LQLARKNVETFVSIAASHNTGLLLLLLPWFPQEILTLSSSGGSSALVASTQL
jgi:hypothetical protein